MAEGGGLLNRCTVKSRTGGSNPPLRQESRLNPAYADPLYLLARRLDVLDPKMGVHCLSGQDGRGRLALAIKQVGPNIIQSHNGI